MNSDNANKLSNYLLIVMVIIFLFIMGMLVYPFKVIEVKSPAEVITKVLQSGDELKYQIEYCVYKNSPVTVRKRIVNKVAYNLPLFEMYFTDGCDNTTVSSIMIPEYIKPGKYYLEIVTIHHINPLRDVEYKWRTEEFEIIGDDKK